MAFWQNDFRWRNDDGDETAATWQGAQDTQVASQPLNANLRLRFAIGSTSAESNFTPGLEVSYNGGVYAQVTNSSSNAKIVASSHVSNATPCTDQLTEGDWTFLDQGTVVASDSAFVGPNLASFPTTNGIEVEFCIQLSSSGTFAFRVCNCYSTPAALDEYYFTPQTSAYATPVAPLVARQGFFGNITAANEIASWEVSATGCYQLQCRLAGLTLSAASLTAFLQRYAGTGEKIGTVGDPTALLPKPSATDTAWGCAFAPIFLTAGETIKLNLTSSNGGDTNVSGTLEVWDAGPGQVTIAAGGITAASLSSDALEAIQDGLATSADTQHCTLDPTDVTAARIAAMTEADGDGWRLTPAALAAVFLVDLADVQDASPENSLLTVCLAGLHSSVAGTTWTIRKTDGTTKATKTVAVSADAAPIVGVT